MSSQSMARAVGIALLVFIAVLMASSGTYVIQPGHRGVEVTLGKVSPAFKPEGFGLKTPLITKIHSVPIRQQMMEKKNMEDIQKMREELMKLHKPYEQDQKKVPDNVG